MPNPPAPDYTQAAVEMKGHSCMPKIFVDTDVIAAITERGKFGETYNDVIREALGLPPLAFQMGGRRLGKPGSLTDLVAVGLLKPGQTLTWHRPNLKQTHEVTVTASGRLRTRTGEVFDSPDACATALAGHPSKGWPNWRTEDGTSLLELRAFLPPDTDKTPPSVDG
ncbi:restriction system modified-DNA reader domain-containing protein [Plantactinospora endophytica]|uniref:RAMA domain-containing protein n=1 Tax=Plantactinospora endophytica TaxID=673535 RepID=A0ABQ4DWW3_9ACTN|nr:hypothetical protein [Plantactinospora endophytica]GIG86949.1 hypothetical protein Pen02_18850 [Plantactinospora endophytica]